MLNNEKLLKKVIKYREKDDKVFNLDEFNINLD